jgi:hypothetical protein
VTDPEVRIAVPPGCLVERDPLPPASSGQERLRFFFKPVQLDLELPDLPVQFGFGFLPVLIGPLPPIGEDVGQLLKKLRFPAADLVGGGRRTRRPTGRWFSRP